MARYFGFILTIISYLMIIEFVLSQEASTKKPLINRGEAFDERIQEFIKTSNLTSENSYRCGVFFAGDELNDAPRLTIFVVPKRFPMECSKDKNALKAEAKEECVEFFKFILKGVSFDSGSRQRQDASIGDDLCKLLKEEGKMKRLPGPGHPRFPKGLTIGFYYNVCTDTKWYDTELRGPKNVCCKPRTKKFAACPDSEK